MWDGLSIAEIRGATAPVTSRFFAHGEQRPTNTNRLYRRDHLGNIRETTDAVSATLTILDYQLWGRRTVLSGAGANEPTFGYTGHYWHERSDLHLAMYRAYSAEIGRWLSRDPIGEKAALNLYGYVSGQVTQTVDLLGLEKEYPPGPNPTLEKACIIGALSKGGHLKGDGGDLLGLFWELQLIRGFAWYDAANAYPGNSDAENALRHCLFACELTKKLGAGTAAAILACHEKYGAGSNDVCDSAIDQINNNVGMRLGKPKANCSTSCNAEMNKIDFQNGLAKTPGDPRVACICKRLLAQ